MKEKFPGNETQIVDLESHFNKRSPKKASFLRRKQFKAFVYFLIAFATGGIVFSLFTLDLFGEERNKASCSVPMEVLQDSFQFNSDVVTVDTSKYCCLPSNFVQGAGLFQKKDIKGILKIHGCINYTDPKAFYNNLEFTEYIKELTIDGLQVQNLPDEIFGPFPNMSLLKIQNSKLTSLDNNIFSMSQNFFGNLGINIINSKLLSFPKFIYFIDGVQSLVLKDAEQLQSEDLSAFDKYKQKESKFNLLLQNVAVTKELWKDDSEKATSELGFNVKILTSSLIPAFQIKELNQSIKSSE